MQPRVPDGSPDHAHAGNAVLSGAQISAINRFPDDNPNPVMRVDLDGHLIYANPASAGVQRAIGAGVGERVPAEILARCQEAAAMRGFLELRSDNRTYAVWPVLIEDLGFMNLYGMDVTAERAIVKFPDQNPNPVLRIDWEGRLVYGNRASAGLTASLGLAPGATLAADLREALLGRARAADPDPLEVEAGGRTYALLPVDVPEFGFVNVYGTDVTAVKERERLARENERLLLNILPAPIAQRLRDGEPLIADRVDDVTLLFADVVEFTRLSSTLSPSELVSVLNEVFSAFDELVDRYDLEKVKTIGDAYMVAGGLTDGSADHTARVADMALALTAAVERIDAAVRLGVRFRIGIHCGPVVAGVIGTRKFIYDIWGDAVNLASRMESLGAPGRIQVTHAVKERLEGRFRLEPRGLIDVKGKGPTPTWYLLARDGVSDDAPGRSVGQTATAFGSPDPGHEQPAAGSPIPPG
jgi:class 3 adenylate cyclase